MKKIVGLMLILVLLTGLFPFPTSSMAAGGAWLNLERSPNTPGSRNVVIGTSDVVALKAIFTTTVPELGVDDLDLKVDVFREDGTPAKPTDIANVYIGANDGHLTLSKSFDSSNSSSITFRPDDWRFPLPIPTTGNGTEFSVILDIPSTCNASGSGLFVSIDGKNIVAPCPVFGSANGTVMKIVSHGSLTVELAADTPPRRIVAVGNGTTNVTLATTQFTAGPEEAILIDAIPIKGGNGGNEFINFSLWENDGTQVGRTMPVLSSLGGAFSVNSCWRIPAGQTKTLTLKADAATLSGNSSGKSLSFGIDTSNISAVGEISCHTILAEPQTLISGNEMILRKSKPYLAAASLPSYALSAGENVFYRNTDTADAKGDVSWKTKVFEMTGEIYVGQDTFVIGSKTENVTDAIYMQSANGTLERLINAASLRVVDVQTGESINGTFLIWNFPDKVLVHYAATSPQTIVDGNTKTYELRGNFLYGRGLIMTKIPEGTVIPDNQHIDRASFTWTDGVAWATDYLVPGIPTATLSLTNGEPPTQPYLTLLSPRAGNTFIRGDNITITWDSVGIDYINIELQDWGRQNEDGSTPFTMCLTDNYSASTGKYSWTIYPDWPTGSLYKIKISTLDNLIGYASGYFSIVAANVTPSIQVLSPNGGETFVAGGQIPISFSTAGSVPVGTHYCINLIRQDGDGQEWTIVEGDITSDNIQNTGLTLPTGIFTFPSGCYRIQVSLTVANALIQDFSDNYFLITTPRGDVNGDGKVNALDLTALERIIAGLD